MLNTTLSPTMLALRYFCFTSAGDFQCSFSTSRNQARSAPSASGYLSQNARRVLFAITRTSVFKLFPERTQVVRSVLGAICLTWRHTSLRWPTRPLVRVQNETALLRRRQSLLPLREGSTIVLEPHFANPAAVGRADDNALGVS